MTTRRHFLIAMTASALSLVAGHALAANLTLITSDAAFKRISGLTVKDWTKA